MTFVPETRPLPPPIPRVSPNDRRKYSAFVNGLASRRVVLAHEDKEAYRELVRSVADEYRPEGALEEHLVIEMAGAVWRIGRARAVEARLLETGGRTEAPASRAAPPVDKATRATARQRRHAINAALNRLRTRTATDYDAALSMLDDQLRACWRERVAGTSTSRETHRPLGTERERRNETSYDLASWLERVRSADDEIINDPDGPEAASHAEDRVAAGMTSLLYQTVMEHEGRFDRHLARTVETLAKLRRIRERMEPEDASGPAGGADGPANGESSETPKKRADAPVAEPARATPPRAGHAPGSTKPAPLNRQQRRRLHALAVC